MTSTLPLPSHPMARSASLAGFAKVARSLGLDPRAQLRAARIDPSCLEDPDLPIPVARVHALLETSAIKAGAEDFGLRIAATRRLSNLGLIALAAREEPTVRDALLCLQRTMQLHNEGLRLELEEEDEIISVRTRILVPVGEPMRQSIELSAGILLRILRELLGSNWLPLSVEFTHRPPRELAAHRALFGVLPRFQAGRNGLILRRTDLDRPVPRADPQSRRTLQQLLSNSSATRLSHRDRTLHLILELLPSGRCTSERVAGFLGVDRRTLARWLKAEGTSFSALMDEVRLEAAHRHLGAAGQSVQALAPVLGFSDGSALARWFSARTGRSPREWRTENGKRRA